ncbi:solute carrier [Histoplasma capsulatum var. duboisii H88]|uniref:Solute carrier n=2 Tax=Ajellomyces capsulatus TaxID=5037 RepID=F0UUD4_AJEC8|nr:solute carrier family 35 member C2 [Histoplasma capsulatum H143]EGC49511.1 solute carrier [Histoplasma capsulatum var. duboisii H88]QSS57653.1 solute carrier family 35 member C2 [Histoplasma capsulatum var. duboisii H88]
MGEGLPDSKLRRRTSSISIYSGTALSPPTSHDLGPLGTREVESLTPNKKNRSRDGEEQRVEEEHRHPQDEEQEEEQDHLLTGTGPKSDRSRHSSFAESEVLEMDFLASDDDLNDDEETGLTAKERRQRWKQRRRHRRELDARIVEVKISEDGRRLADRAVVKRLGLNAILIGSWYIFSLSISIYNKWMFSSNHLNFQFPLFTTGLHMVVQFILSSTVLYFVPSLRPHDASLSSHSVAGQQPKPLMSKQFYLSRLVPCGAATSLDVGLGNMSLRFITLTFLTMCKSSSLAFVLLFAFLFRLEIPSLKLILIIGTMTIGVVMMVAGEAAFNALGFSLIIASAFFSGFRWGLTQILLLRHPATANPFSMLFFLTPIMFVCLTALAFAVEGPLAIIKGISNLTADGILRGVGILVFPGCLAFCMIASEFALLKRSSVVTLSICGIFKEVITISAAGIVFHDPLTPINVSGLIITIGAIACYNYIKITKMRREARLDIAESVNPTDVDSDDEESIIPSASSNPFVSNDTNNNTTTSTTTNHHHKNNIGNTNLSTRLSLSRNTSPTSKDGKYIPVDTNIPTDETTHLGPSEDRGRHSIRARVGGTTSASSSLVATAAGASGAGSPPALRSPLRSNMPLGGSAVDDSTLSFNGSSLSSSSLTSAARVPSPGNLQRSLSWKGRSVSPKTPLPDKMNRD